MKNLTSGVSKKFSTNHMIMLKVFKWLLKSVSFRWITTHDLARRERKKIAGNAQKLRKHFRWDSFSKVKIAKVTWHENKLSFQKYVKLTKIVRNGREILR